MAGSLSEELVPICGLSAASSVQAGPLGNPAPLFVRDLSSATSFSRCSERRLPPTGQRSLPHHHAPGDKGATFRRIVRELLLVPPVVAKRPQVKIREGEDCEWETGPVTTSRSSARWLQDLPEVARARGVPAARHDGNILFGFVRAESRSVEADGHPRRDLTAGDAFVLPPHVRLGMHAPADDLEILEVALPNGVGTALA